MTAVSAAPAEQGSCFVALGPAVPAVSLTTG